MSTEFTPDFPGIDEFYSTQPVITSADQLKPGVKATEYFGPDDPQLGGTRLEILGEPEPYVGHGYCPEIIGHLMVRIQRYYADGLPAPQESHIFLRDRGIMPDGEEPLNKNRLVLGWKDTQPS